MEEITLTHKENFFSIEFAYLDYVTPSGNKYAFKLENFDKRWRYVSASERMSTYMNLSPGNYIFHVKASNDDGYWNKEGTSIKVIILPPWWLLWWVKVLYAVSFIALLFLLYKRKTRLLHHQKMVLERMVDSRTSELSTALTELSTAHENLKSTQNHLIQSEKMASLGVLATGVGHEINNPLNYIKSGLKALFKVIDENSKKDFTKYINIVNDGVDRASIIVKSLSQFSKAGVEFNEYCKVDDIIENCLLILANELKKIQVDKCYIETPTIVHGNEGKLHQVFMNILSNAVQAINGNGKITISTVVDNGKVVVSIKDNGHGIPKENLSKIGDPFFTTKPPGSGTGLGLYIVYSIVEEHEGDIQVTSEQNNGTEFIITLPLYKKQNT